MPRRRATARARQARARRARASPDRRASMVPTTPISNPTGVRGVALGGGRAEGSRARLVASPA
eukprot:10461276-Lingulodinium_polyedra.AAC.1